MSEQGKVKQNIIGMGEANFLQRQLDGVASYNQQFGFEFAIDHCMVLGLLCSKCQAVAWMMHDEDVDEVPEQSDFCSSCQTAIEAQQAADAAEMKSEVLAFKQWAQDRNIPISGEALTEWEKTVEVKDEPHHDPGYLLQELFEAHAIQQEIAKVEKIEGQIKALIRGLEDVQFLESFLQDVNLQRSCKEVLSNIQQLIPELTTARERVRVRTSH